MNAIPIPWTAGLVISTYSYWNSAMKTRTKWVNRKEQRSFCPVYSLRPCLLRAVSVWTIPSNRSRIQMYIPKWCLKWYKAAQTRLCALESHCHTVPNVDFLSAVLTTNVSITEFQQAPKTARAPASFSDSEVRIIRWHYTNQTRLTCLVNNERCEPKSNKNWSNNSSLNFTFCHALKEGQCWLHAAVYR